MTNENDGQQHNGQWGEPPVTPPPVPPNPFSQVPPAQQPPQNPYSQPQAAPEQENPYTQQQPYPQTPPNPYTQGAPNPYAQNASGEHPTGEQPPVAPNPYNQGQQSQGAYGQNQQAPQPQNPYSQAQPTAAYPPSAQPTAAYPAGSSAQTEAYPPMGGQPPLGPTPPKKKRSKAPWIAGGVVLLLLIVGGIVGINLGNAAHAPHLPVAAYLDALKKGDAEGALKLAKVTVEKTDLLLTNEAYKNAEDKITRYTIGESSVSDETATIEASITQGGEKYDTEFTLTRTGKDAVLFDVWELDAPPIATVAVSIAAPEDSVLEVAGLDATSALSEGAAELRALPGTYSVALGGDAEFFEAEPASASVVGFTADTVEAEPLTVALTEAGTTAATDAVNTWLDACIASKELAPKDCPFFATNPRNYKLSNIVWTVTKPTFTVGEYSAGGWSVTSDSDGTAKATASAEGAGTTTSGELPFDIAGVVEGFSDNGAIFVPAV
ncbi:hypothetical protein D9V29_05930 [Mycetocola manganoxydans]|uniref:DUF4878 domain-containing protein n=1 Tax=Mycetocola manganoxydans TaxID=699879 RepID=A0A3L6ZXW2_9MICO|nr:hypothetical protein [Mycetocola manganoxydans]RLP71972.1 hypothetical protein D9V29_05930 [Mycetocola manganoxydans]GHD47337.1 hypothetical protein GCM10008097_18170 [Mycetocola manganoxydans]